MSIENTENYTDAAPCVQKTAELSDWQIMNIAKESYITRQASVVEFSRELIAADRKLRGDA